MGFVRAKSYAGLVEPRGVDPQASVGKVNADILGGAVDRDTRGDIQRGHHAAVQGGVADVIGHIDVLNGVVLKDLGHRADVVVVVVGDDEVVDLGDAVLGELTADGGVVVGLARIHENDGVIHADQDGVGVPRVQEIGAKNVGGVLKGVGGRDLDEAPRGRLGGDLQVPAARALVEDQGALCRIVDLIRASGKAQQAQEQEGGCQQLTNAPLYSGMREMNVHRKHLPYRTATSIPSKCGVHTHNS